MMDSNEEQMAQDNLPPVEDIRTWQQQLVQGVLRAMLIFGLFMAAAGSYSGYARGALWVIPIYLGVYAIIVVVAIWRQATYALQVGAILVLLYVIAVVTFFTRGIGDSSRVYLLVVLFATGIFFKWRESILVLVLVLLTMAGFGWAFSAGYITGYEEVVSTDPIAWVALTFDLLGMGVFVVVSLNFLVPRLASALRQSHRLTKALEQEQSRLEELVAERTADLARRSEQLETAAQVAREAAAIQDIDQTLEQTANLISERFGFYHTGLFLLDPSGEWVVLQAASSLGGQKMLTRGHRLRVGLGGIVGHVAGHARHRIALDVGLDAVFFDNPDLPDTRSEMALPLRVRGEVIGVLDVQSVEKEAFSDEDVAVLQTLADQVAVAISNARLLQQVQESLDAERRAYGTVSREAWIEQTRAQPDLGYRRTASGFQPAGDLWRPQMVEALRSGETTVGQRDDETMLSLPVKWRDQVIGVIEAHKRDESGQWTQDEVALVEAVIEQVGVALESARLHQDTERRAAREQLVGEITARMRETLSIDTVLQTALQELGTVLDIPRIQVRMGSTATRPGNGRTAAKQNVDSVTDPIEGSLPKENKDADAD